MKQMSFEAQPKKIGNSYWVLIPASAMKSMGLDEQSTVEVRLKKSDSKE